MFSATTYPALFLSFFLSFSSLSLSLFIVEHTGLGLRFRPRDETSHFTVSRHPNSVVESSSRSAMISYPRDPLPPSQVRYDWTLEAKRASNHPQKEHIWFGSPLETGSVAVFFQAVFPSGSTRSEGDAVRV